MIIFNRRLSHQGDFQSVLEKKNNDRKMANSCLVISQSFLSFAVYDISEGIDKTRNTEPYQSLPDKYSCTEFHDHAPKIWLTRIAVILQPFSVLLTLSKKSPMHLQNIKVYYLSLRLNFICKNLDIFSLRFFSLYFNCLTLFQNILARQTTTRGIQASTHVCIILLREISFLLIHMYNLPSQIGENFQLGKWHFKVATYGFQPYCYVCQKRREARKALELPLFTTK